MEQDLIDQQFKKFVSDLRTAYYEDAKAQGNRAFHLKVSEGKIGNLAPQAKKQHKELANAHDIQSKTHRSNFLSLKNQIISWSKQCMNLQKKNPSLKIYFYLDVFKAIGSAPQSEISKQVQQGSTIK